MNRHYCFATFLLLATVSAMNVFTQPSSPLVIAHRGDSGAAPENTLAAIHSAISLNPQPEYVEIDLYRSIDGVLVVNHDTDTLRTTGVPGMVREQTFDALRQLDAGYASVFGERFRGERMPTLEEVLDAVKDTPIGVMIECKQLLLEDQVIELLRERNEVHKHVLASFDELTVYRAKQLEPELRTLYLTTLNDRNLWRARDVQADIIGTHRDASDDMIAKARQAGYPVWVWTVNEPDEMDRFVRLGVDGIISDYPARVFERIQAVQAE